jgi:predicted DNA-binding protein with PD1-like motif
MKQITVRLRPGQYLKEEIEKLAAEKNIGAGVLLSIVGGLESAVLRMAGAEPDNQPVKKWNEPFEIVSGTGTISKDGCHIHVALSDKEGNVIGGHLKDGCIVNSTAEIVIGVFEGVEYRRVFDGETGFKELTVNFG